MINRFNKKDGNEKDKDIWLHSVIIAALCLTLMTSVVGTLPLAAKNID